MAWHPFRNLGLKALALVLGTLIWFTVSGQQVERPIMDIPVVYVNKPDGFEITDQTSTVDIHVRGLDSQLRTTQPRDFEARVDLTGARQGTQEIPLRTDQITSPFGVDVTEVDPAAVMVFLEVSGAANLAVRPKVEGMPAAGFVVSEMTVEPASVTVLGPARRISGIDAATTDRVSIDGASANVVETVSVGVPDAGLRLKQPTAARVVIKIEPAGDRMFAAARVSVRNLGSGLHAEVDPAVVSVLLRGALSVLARLGPTSVVPYVDVTNLGPGRHEVPVVFDPVGTVTGVVRPATVTVEIK